MATANAEMVTREEFRTDRVLVGADQPVSLPLLAQLLASIAARAEPRTYRANSAGASFMRMAAWSSRNPTARWGNRSSL
jgi:hypothetical protein